MLLEGIFLPITTPFYPDGRLYLRKLEHNIARYSLTPAAGMLVLGEAGEPDGLTDLEMLETLRTAIVSATKEKVMIAAVGRASVFATLTLADAAAIAGYDAIAVKAPEFAGEPSMRVELMTYFRAIADSSPLPVIVLAESRPLPAETLGELAAHPSIIGAIDVKASPARMESLRALTANITREVTVTTIFAAATGRMRAPSEPPNSGSFVSAKSLGAGGTALAIAPPVSALKTRTKRVGFQLLCGSTRRMLEAWSAGATGAVPRLASAAPQGCSEVWQAFKDGDTPLAEEKQARLKSAAELVEGWSGIAALKHGCDLNGYYGGRPRLPLLTLTQEKRHVVESAMAPLRN